MTPCRTCTLLEMAGSGSPKETNSYSHTIGIRKDHFRSPVKICTNFEIRHELLGKWQGSTLPSGGVHNGGYRVKTGDPPSRYARICNTTPIGRQHPHLVASTMGLPSETGDAHLSVTTRVSVAAITTAGGEKGGGEGAVQCVAVQRAVFVA